jgi:hypothetical protein
VSKWERALDMAKLQRALCGNDASSEEGTFEPHFPVDGLSSNE